MSPTMWMPQIPGMRVHGLSESDVTSATILDCDHPDLLGGYKFESGGIADDCSDNENDLTAVGSPANGTGVCGESTSSIVFDGVDDYFKRTRLDTSQAFSISVWVKWTTVDTVNGDTIIANKSNTTGTAFEWNLGSAETTGKVTMEVNTSDGLATNTDGFVPDADQWYHILVTVGGGDIKVYKDGVLDSSGTYTGTIRRGSTGTRIGRQGWKALAAATLFSGEMDNLRVFRRVVTAGEIASLWGECTIPGEFAPSDVANLVVWLDGADATTLYTDGSYTSPVTTDGDTVRGWTDKSGQDNHFYNVEGRDEPSYKETAVNSLSAVEFPAEEGLLEHGYQIITDDNFTVMAAVRYLSGSTNYGQILMQHNGGSYNGRAIFLGSDTSDSTKMRHFFNNGTSRVLVSTTTACSTTATTLQCAESDGAGNSWVRVNGGEKEAELTGQTWTPYNTKMSVGGYNSDGNVDGQDSLHGYVCEVLVYTPKISDADRQDVETYLINKWGIS